MNRDRKEVRQEETTPLITKDTSSRTTNLSDKLFMLGSSSESEEGQVLSSDDTVFGAKSANDDELAATWGGSHAQPESGRLRRTQSWSAGPPDDDSSEIRILRERLLRTQTRPRPGALRHLSSHQKVTLALLALVDFMSFCSMSVMAPFFPREATAKGLSDTVCGLVFSFYAVVMFVTSPIFGKFLPQLGAKFMFTSGMFIAGSCNVIFGMLVLVEDSSTFTILCFVVRGLEALGASAYSTASYVYVVNVFPESIGSVLGILETFVGMGMSVGPAIGGFLYSIGGFGLPFYSLGVVMVVAVPATCLLLTDCEDYVSGSKTASILRLFKIPSIIITGLVIVVVSNVWAFLDPTLEPHMRQFGLSTEQMGLIFLLFSSLYGIFSPIWGWVADRVHNHWCMMVWGLFFSSVGLLLLGPCPFIPGLPTDLWLDLVALSILGISVALTLLPTFQGVLTSSIYEGGCPEALPTYSAVAGVWSCCYSLGEVLGPSLGGALAERYGFPLSATLCATACFTMAVITLTFFSLRESRKVSPSVSWGESLSSDVSAVSRSRSAPDRDTAPLLAPCECADDKESYNTLPKRCLLHRKRSYSENAMDGMSYFLKFQYLTNTFAKLRIKKRRGNDWKSPPPSTELYQDYLKEKQVKESKKDSIEHQQVILDDTHVERDKYVTYLENAIFGSPDIVDNLDNLVVKRNNRGLVPKFLPVANERRPPEDILRHNMQKVMFYEQNQACASVDIFDACGCKGDVTFVRGTVALSSTGACEV